MGTVYAGQVTDYRVPVRSAHPLAVMIARQLGRLYGRDIAAQSNGAIRFGQPGLSGGRRGYWGYVNPPQLFVGWNPHKVAAGSVRPTLGKLPGTQAPYANTGPLLAAMYTVSGVPSSGGVGGA